MVRRRWQRYVTIRYSNDMRPWKVFHVRPFDGILRSFSSKALDAVAYFSCHEMMVDPTLHGYGRREMQKTLLQQSQPNTSCVSFHKRQVRVRPVLVSASEGQRGSQLLMPEARRSECQGLRRDHPRLVWNKAGRCDRVRPASARNSIASTSSVFLQHAPGLRSF